MAQAEVISEILSLYKKHGWSLRRVLLSENSLKIFSGSHEKIFGEAEILASEIDAAWFSRPSGKTAWELRHLSETPFALFELFETDADAAFVREKQLEMEDKLKSRVIISR
jgi:hypothetical protein